MFEEHKGGPVFVMIAGGQVYVGICDGIEQGIFLKLSNPIQCSYSPNRPWPTFIEKGPGDGAVLRATNTTIWVNYTHLRLFCKWNHAYPEPTPEEE